jgi:PTH1 family peptidyl-tRNA hydrolase
VGLGNPGRRYVGTRHNIGFEVLDRLAARHRLEWEAAPRGVEALAARAAVGADGSGARVLFAKPLTFMNLSGRAVLGLAQFFKIELPDLLIVVDDVNLQLGRLRARASGSAGGHNGLKSIIEVLATEDFARLRIGVGRGDARDLADHVLARFDPEERANVAAAADRAADAAELFVTSGIETVMNRFNRREDADRKEDGD